jgi:hypothetical protein
MIKITTSPSPLLSPGQLNGGCQSVLRSLYMGSVVFSVILIEVLKRSTELSLSLWLRPSETQAISYTSFSRKRPEFPSGRSSALTARMPSWVMSKK